MTKTELKTNYPHFFKAVEYLLEDEGVWSNDPVDPGGATKYGWTYRSWVSMVDPDCTPEQHRNITKQEARLAYKDHFWLSVYDELDPALAGEVFNFAVNGGRESAHRSLQKAIRFLGENIRNDGDIGSKTLAAIDRLKQSRRGPDLRLEFIAQILWRYNRLTHQKPQLKKFIHGWIRRALKAYRRLC